MSILKKVEYFRRSLKEELTPEQIDRLQITFHDIEQQKMPQGSKISNLNETDRYLHWFDLGLSIWSYKLNDPKK